MVVLPFLNPFCLILSLQSVSDLILFMILHFRCWLLVIIKQFHNSSTFTEVTCFWYWDQVWYRPLFRTCSFYQGSVTEIWDEISVLHHLRILDHILSPPQPSPSYRLLCLVILLRCKWPSFDVQVCGNWINVLCFIIEAGRVTKKGLKVVVPISAWVSPSHWPWKADWHPLSSLINFQWSLCLLLLWAFLISVTFSVSYSSITSVCFVSWSLPLDSYPVCCYLVNFGMSCIYLVLFF